MKIMLKQDVHGTGKAGDIVTVSDGYASNFLIPRGLAVPADAGTINAANIRKQAAKHRVEVQRKNAQALAANMSKLSVKVYCKAGENGRLFGAVTGKEIAAALKEGPTMLTQYFDDIRSNARINRSQTTGMQM